MLQDLAMINRRTFLKSAAAGTLIYPATSWGASEKPVKIGSLNPRTGSYAALGDNQVRGAKLAVDELN